MMFLSGSAPNIILGFESRVKGRRGRHATEIAITTTTVVRLEMREDRPARQRKP